jgi:hypothetical protein
MKTGFGGWADENESRVSGESRVRATPLRGRFELHLTLWPAGSLAPDNSSSPPDAGAGAGAGAVPLPPISSRSPASLSSAHSASSAGSGAERRQPAGRRACCLASADTTTGMSPGCSASAGGGARTARPSRTMPQTTARG